MPEPKGDRWGQSGQGRALSVLIVGDSAALGIGVEYQYQALSGNLVTLLGDTHKITWKVFAHSGDTSAQFLQKLHQLPAQNIDIAVVSIGVNDVTGLTRSKVWVTNVRLIIQELTDRFAVHRVYLTSIPPMHLFPNLPKPLAWWLGLRARHFNAVMNSVTQSEALSTYVPVPFSDDLSEIAADGFHPGSQAYQVWAEHLAALILNECERCTAHR